MRQQHYFHLVNPSPWPILTGFSLLQVTTGAVMYLHFYKNGYSLLLWGLVCLLLCMYQWWGDVIIEGTFQGCHTRIVQQGLRFGIVLFILSEVMFFLSFFWAFFHSSLAPDVSIGCVWPPAEIKVFNAWEVPLLNTIILLSSGCTVTWAHYVLCIPKTIVDIVWWKNTKLIKLINLEKGNIEESTKAFELTIGLALLFTCFQAYEYYEAPFSILDGIYGSTFFLLTGFHGLHVIIGTIFLLVCAIRNYEGHFSTTHHIGFEGAVWYWHFVDVVWLFLFVIVYYWGGYIGLEESVNWMI